MIIYFSSWIHHHKYNLQLLPFVNSSYSQCLSSQELKGKILLMISFRPKFKPDVGCNRNVEKRLLFYFIIRCNLMEI
jgi:hypothetical protein